MLTFFVGKSPKITLGVGSTIMISYDLLTLLPDSDVKSVLNPLFSVSVCLSLPQIYLAWFAVILIMFPICK
ncbi:MAG: hypothetical protein ACK4YV_03175 [Emticicia sp.]